MTARAGGVSVGPYAACNLGDHVGDAPEAVAANRARLAGLIGAEPVWMTQVHGADLIRLTHRTPRADALHGVRDWNPRQSAGQAQADGALTTEPGLACTVMVADCLPLLLAAPQGRGVAALHAGWRGLAGAGGMGGRGIVHTGVAALCEAAACDPADLQVWLGPCIGAAHFEVGADVLEGFGVDPADAASHPRFTRRADRTPPKWLADLPGLAGDLLRQLGVSRVQVGSDCTVSDASRFFSFRRDRVTGRQAACIWLD